MAFISQSFCQRWTVPLKKIFRHHLVKHWMSFSLLLLILSLQEWDMKLACMAVVWSSWLDIETDRFQMYFLQLESPKQKYSKSRKRALIRLESGNWVELKLEHLMEEIFWEQTTSASDFPGQKLPQPTLQFETKQLAWPDCRSASFTRQNLF